MNEDVRNQSIKACAFIYKNSAGAGSVGYGEEKSPTLRTNANISVVYQPDRHIGQNKIAVAYKREDKTSDDQ